MWKFGQGPVRRDMKLSEQEMHPTFRMCIGGLGTGL